MKRKLLIIASLLMLVLSGCCEIQSKKKNPEVIKDHDTPERVKEFNYRGHDYIKFEDGYGNNQSAGVVHDPDCKKCRDGSYEKDNIHNNCSVLSYND